jgi:RNA polymerase sigma-70 factor (ECF subfamily)
MADSLNSSRDSRLQRAKQGDEAALGELLDEFRPYLRLLAVRALDDRMAGRVDASDVVQQTCLSAVRRFTEFTGDDVEGLIGWLRVIHEHNLVDTARKHLEAERRSVRREEPDAAPDRLAIEELTSPSHRLMKGERAVELARWLSTLPADQCVSQSRAGSVRR